MVNESVKRIVVVVSDRDLGEMFATVLLTAGYRAEWRSIGPSIAAEVREAQPDLLIVGMPPAVGDATYALVDLFRSDESIRSIPVLAVTGSADVAERAPASFNVKGTLVMPFDLDELFEEARRALSEPMFHRDVTRRPQPAGIFRLAEDTLAARSRGTLFRWVQRLRTETELRGRVDLKLSDVLDHVPVLIEALSAALHYESPAPMLAENPELAARVRLHAITRRSQGISLELLIREYALLREELWRTLWHELPEDVGRDDFARLQSVVDGTLDLIIQQTVPSYLEARDEGPTG